MAHVVAATSPQQGVIAFWSVAGKDTRRTFLSITRQMQVLT